MPWQDMSASAEKGHLLCPGRSTVHTHVDRNSKILQCAWFKIGTSLSDPPTSTPKKKKERKKTGQPSSFNGTDLSFKNWFVRPKNPVCRFVKNYRTQMWAQALAKPSVNSDSHWQKLLSAMFAAVPTARGLFWCNNPLDKRCLNREIHARTNRRSPVCWDRMLDCAQVSSRHQAVGRRPEIAGVGAVDKGGCGALYENTLPLQRDKKKARVRKK